MAIKEDLVKKYRRGPALKGFTRLQNHVGNLEHHAEERNQIDASHEEVDYDEGYLKSIPPGYKFDPDDVELIVDYLKRKVDNQPLPPNRIKEVRLYDSNPMTLSEEFKPIGKIWYFFTKTAKKYPNGSAVNRSTKNGYWKCTDCEAPVVSSENVTVGYKRRLVFYEEGHKTNWIMYEYRVADPPQRTKKCPNDMRLADCVLCKFYLTKTKSVSGRPNDIGEDNNLVDVMLVLSKPNDISENNTKDVMHNTPKRQKIGSNDMRFDDFTMLSQPLESNTNINSYIGPKFDDFTMLSQPLESNTNINSYIGPMFDDFTMLSQPLEPDTNINSYIGPMFDDFTMLSQPLEPNTNINSYIGPMFDDSTMLSQLAEQTTNINSYVHAADSFSAGLGIAENNDAWILGKDGVLLLPLHQNTNINSYVNAAENVDNPGFNIPGNVDLESSQSLQDALENVEFNILENLDVGFSQYPQDDLYEFQMDGELPFSPQLAGRFNLHNGGHQVRHLELSRLQDYFLSHFYRFWYTNFF